MMTEDSKYYDDVVELIDLLQKASKLDVDAFNKLVQLNSHTFWLAPCLKKANQKETAVAVEKVYDTLNALIIRANKSENNTFALFVEFCVENAETLLKELKKSIE